MSTATNPALSDEELARAADVAGLYARYSRRLLAFLSGLGLIPADVDDVHQETWVRVVTALKRAPFAGTFRAWLFQVARNASVDLARKRRPGTLPDEFAAEGRPVEQGLIDAEYQARLEHCLERLSESESALVRGRLAGDGYDVLSSRMGLSPQRAHKLFFLAKQSLETCLGTGPGD